MMMMVMILYQVSILRERQESSNSLITQFDGCVTSDARGGVSRIFDWRVGEGGNPAPGQRRQIRNAELPH